MEIFEKGRRDLCGQDSCFCSLASHWLRSHGGYHRHLSYRRAYRPDRFDTPLRRASRSLRGLLTTVRSSHARLGSFLEARRGAPSFSVKRVASSVTRLTVAVVPSRRIWRKDPSTHGHRCCLRVLSGTTARRCGARKERAEFGRCWIRPRPPISLRTSSRFRTSALRAMLHTVG